MWQAKFNDNTIIEEFDNNQNEVSFKHVLNRITELVSLSIIQGAKMYTVNMLDGKFNIIQSGIPFEFHAIDFDTMKCGKIQNIRPIYFVRETVDFKVNQPAAGSNKRAVFVALGFQGNIGDKNIKRYLAILPDGTFTIEDK